MNRADFVKEIARQKGMSKQQAYRAVNVVMDMLRIMLGSGEPVEVGGFGTFDVLTDLEEEHIPVLKGGKALKRVLNTSATLEKQEVSHG